MNALDTYADLRTKWNERGYESIEDIVNNDDLHGIRLVNTNASFRTKMAYSAMLMITLIGGLLGLICVFLLPTTLAVVSGGAIMGSVLAGCLASTKLLSVESDVIPKVRGLKDEVKGIVKTMERLQTTKTMLPEGSGFQNRIDEYCRLSYVLLCEVDRLPASVSGRDPHSHAILNEIRTKMTALSESGQELESLIHYKRSENTLASIEVLGIDQYTDAISIETATHRALGTGTSDDALDELREELSDTPGISVKKPIPPRPRGVKADWLNK